MNPISDDQRETRPTNEYDLHSVYVLYGMRLFGGVIYELV